MSKASRPNINLISIPAPLIFYDGSTGEYTNYFPGGAGTGKYADLSLNLAGGQYMFFVGLDTAGYELGSSVAGWTAGTPFYWVKTDEVRGMAQNITKQGATAGTKGYAYINWTEDDREFILFNGFTGPPGTLGTVYRSVEDHNLLQKTMAKYLVGGTGVDGEQFQGLKQIFPGISFGFYNIPPWWRHDTMWTGTTTNIENSLELAANVVVGCTELMDAIDLLMPSGYSLVTKRDHTMIANEQNVKLCQKINQKLIAAGKTPKQIIPFVEPFYETVASGRPYDLLNAVQGGAYSINNLSSYARAIHGLTKMNIQYIPPYTRMLESDLVHEAYNPMISNGADGAIIWLGPSYRMKQIAGRTLNPLCCEDIVVSDPYTDGSGNLQWNSAWRRGVTGATAVWSQKDMWRQSLTTDWAYRAGICLGITGNRWWWKNDQTSGGPYGACGPSEWFPLSGNEGLCGPTLGNQRVSGFGMSTKNTRDRIDKYLMEIIKENIQIWRKTWIGIKK